MPVLSIKRCIGPVEAPARQDDGEILLTTAERAEIGNGPVEPGQLQEARDEFRRLTQRHSEHHPGSSPGQALERQTRLNGGIAIDLPTTAFARWSSFPYHLDANTIGRSGDVGHGLDLIFGYREFNDVEIEIEGSAFLPGTAFGETDDPAFFVSAAIEIKF